MIGKSDTLSQLILTKLEEQIERAEHLITLIPPDKLQWRPQPNSFRVCDLLGHLLECLAGFCATLYALNPEALSHFSRLRELRASHCCSIGEATTRIGEYRNHIAEGLALVLDEDLSRCIPTVFAPEGDALLTLLLANLEHLTNHKYQLFSYLKLLGVEVGSSDLYSFR